MLPELCADFLTFRRSQDCSLEILKRKAPHSPSTQARNTTAKSSSKLQNSSAASATYSLTSIVRSRSVPPLSRPLASFGSSSRFRDPGQHVHATAPTHWETLHPARTHLKIAVTRRRCRGTSHYWKLVEILTYDSRLSHEGSHNRAKPTVSPARQTGPRIHLLQVDVFASQLIFRPEETAMRQSQYIEPSLLGKLSYNCANLSFLYISILSTSAEHYFLIC
jgi:hypothetical protein